MRADLEADTFDFSTLKETPTTVYLVLPPEFLASHGIWLRMMVASILRPMLRSTVQAASARAFHARRIRAARSNGNYRR